MTSKNDQAVQGTTTIAHGARVMMTAAHANRGQRGTVQWVDPAGVVILLDGAAHPWFFGPRTFVELAPDA